MCALTRRAAVLINFAVHVISANLEQQVGLLKVIAGSQLAGSC